MISDEQQSAAVHLAGSVKRRLVDFAISPPFERHLRRIGREIAENSPGIADPGVAAVERLLFDFRFDDGTTVVDRFVRRPRLDEAERAMARGFLDGIDSVFEVMADVDQGATQFPVRCCLSELDHVVVPTEPHGMPALSVGMFLAGRLVPVAGTDLWTTSGVHEVLPESRRSAVVDIVRELALTAPWLTHRNPEKLRQAERQVAAIHERFVVRVGSDLVLVGGAEAELAGLYAEVIVPGDAADDADGALRASSREMARRSIEESELAEATEVLVHSHPVAGLGFYLDYPGVARALRSGAAADADDLVLLRGYLDDPTTPSWLVRRLVAEHWPASEKALARAMRRPEFDWELEGEQLLASLPGDQVPRPTLAIVPEMCGAPRPAADRP